MDGPQGYAGNGTQPDGTRVAPRGALSVGLGYCYNSARESIERRDFLGWCDSENETVAGKLRGKVIAVRDNGDVVADLMREQFRGVSNHQKMSVTCEGHCTAGIFDASHSEPAMTLVALWGPEGHLELTLVGENASEFLGIKSGAPIVVEW